MSRVWDKGNFDSPTREWALTTGPALHHYCVEVSHVDLPILSVYRKFVTGNLVSLAYHKSPVAQWYSFQSPNRKL